MFGLSWGTVQLCCWLGLAALACGAVGYVEFEWNRGKQAEAQIAVLTGRQKAVAGAEKIAVKSAAAGETAAQQALSAQARVIIKKVPVYVSLTAPSVGVPCVSNGLVRLHDAAVMGVDPDSLPAAGGANDACSAIAPAAFASTIASNYAAARANAEQLDALEGDFRAQADAAAGRASVAGPSAPIASDVPY